jgi:hypothetical protein
MNLGQVRQFVRVSDGRIGAVIAGEGAGGVYRGHCDLWFGIVAEGVPVVEQLCIDEDWEEIPAPIGVISPRSGVSMLEAAIEAVEHVAQANWDGREEAAKQWLRLVDSGKTDKSLDDIQREVNSE